MSEKFEISFFRVNENSLYINWENIVSSEILFDIRRFESYLRKKIKFTDISHAYNTILIQFNSPITDFNVACEELRTLYAQSQDLPIDEESQHWRIPVCYQKPYAVDLEKMSIELKISENEIVRRHTKQIYTVYFIGFLPGFSYLGGLDPKIQFPRKSNPRTRIRKGSVGIGGSHTGVYTVESPGGWNIIGFTPIHFFDYSLESGCLTKSGDTVEFFEISPDQLKDYQK